MSRGHLIMGVATLGALSCLFPCRSAASPPDAPSSQVTAARVTIFYIADPAISPKLLTRISRHINKALRKDRRLAIKDSDKLLAEFAGDIPVDDLSNAKKTNNEGIRLLQEGSFKLAAAKLTEAIQQYEGILAFVKKRRLATCMLSLGVAHAKAGHRRKALSTFKRLLIWRPRVRFPVDLYGAKAFSIFRKASAQVKRLRRGSVELTSTPSGAKAYVDGRFAGITPTVAFGLRAGTHYATYKKSGFIKGAQAILVSGRKQQSYDIELHRSEKFLILKQTLAKARAGIGAPRANSAMVDLRSVLFIDQVLFVTTKSLGKETFQVSTYLYDLRSKLRLNQAKMTVTQENLKRLRELARLTYVNVRLDGALDAPPDAPPPPPKHRRPFYATWWFWTAAAAVAAGTAAAIAVPLALQSDPSCPEGKQCITVQN